MDEATHFVESELTMQWGKFMPVLAAPSTPVASQSGVAPLQSEGVTHWIVSAAAQLAVATHSVASVVRLAQQVCPPGQAGLGQAAVGLLPLPLPDDDDEPLPECEPLPEAEPLELPEDEPEDEPGEEPDELPIEPLPVELPA